MGQLQKGWYAYSRNTRRRKKKTEKNFWNNKWLRILSINANPQIQETLRVPSKKLKKKKKKPFPESHRRVQVFWELAAHSPCLAPAINVTLSFTATQRQETGFAACWASKPRSRASESLGARTWDFRPCHLQTTWPWAGIPPRRRLRLTLNGAYFIINPFTQRHPTPSACQARQWGYTVSTAESLCSPGRCSQGGQEKKRITTRWEPKSGHRGTGLWTGVVGRIPRRDLSWVLKAGQLSKWTEQRKGAPGRENGTCQSPELAESIQGAGSYSVQLQRGGWGWRRGEGQLQKKASAGRGGPGFVMGFQGQLSTLKPNSARRD